MQQDTSNTAALYHSESRPAAGSASTPRLCCKSGGIQHHQTRRRREDDALSYFLNEVEYLSFLRRESGCSLIRTMSSDQREAFLELACICLDYPERFPRDCCELGNASIDIAGAQKLESERLPAEQAAIQHICEVTYIVLPDVCAPPTTMDIPTAPAPSAVPQDDSTLAALYYTILNIVLTLVSNLVQGTPN